MPHPRVSRRWWSAAVLVLAALMLFGASARPAMAGAPPNRLDDNRGNILTVAGEALVSALVTAACPICSVDIGGRVQSNPHVFNVFWDGNWNADNPSSPSVSTINNMVSTLVGSDYLDHANQYGVHRGGFDGSHEATACGGTPSGSVSFLDLLGYITCEVQLPGTGVPYPDDNTVYGLFLPEGATVSGAIGASCQPGGAFAFHAWSAAFTIEIHFILGIPVPVPTVQGYPFTVVPADCAIANTGFPIKNVVDGMSELFSHELAEATIDPFPPTGWIDNSKFDINNLPAVFSQGEPGDICSGVGDVPTTPVRMASDGVLVAPYWSNADNACVPFGATFSLNETGLPGTVPHTATLDGSTVTLPFSDQLEIGGTHSFSYPTPVADPNPGIRYVTTHPPTTVTLSGNFSDTAIYTREFFLTTGTDPGFLSGSDGSLTPSGWHADGSTVSLTTDALIPTGPGDRYRFDHWNGPVASSFSRSTSILMNAPKTATAAYQLQHKVVFDQSGIDPGVTWHLVSVNTPNESSANVVGPYTTWVDHGGNVSFTYESPVPGSPGTQYVFTGSTPASPFAANAATNVIGNFKTQYLLTVRTNGLGTNLTHVFNNGGLLGTATDASPLSLFLDKGTVLALAADANVDGAGGVQYFFQGFTPAPPATLLAPFTTTAGYETMEQLINDALASGGISGPSANGVGNALKQKFANIQAKMGAPQYNAALGELTAFINQIDAQCCTPASGKEITSALAATLQLDALIVYHNALCKGIANGQIGAVAAVNDYAYYSGRVTGLGGTPLAPC